MKRIVIFLLVFALFFCVMLSACSAGDIKPTEDGVLTEVRGDSGNLTGYERRYHNDNGDITRLDVYDAEQVYQSFVIYEYDDNGLLYTETDYQTDGIAVSRDVYSYDESGAVYEIAHESPYGDATVDRYDANGEVVEKFCYDTDGRLERHEELKDGVWTEISTETE